MTKTVLKAFLLLVGVLVLGAAGVVAYLATTGVSAREEPGAIETFLARKLRTFAIARRARESTNPVERAPEIIAAGRRHFAEHCAVCHDNDGSGNTTLGRGMWPKPPDLRREETQKLSDGEIFYIIEHGIRFSGMPGFGTGTAEKNESWHLVHFIRHLPDISQPELAEMAELSPKPAEERQRRSPSKPHTH